MSLISEPCTLINVDGRENVKRSMAIFLLGHLKYAFVIMIVTYKIIYSEMHLYLSSVILIKEKWGYCRIRVYTAATPC